MMVIKVLAIFDSGWTIEQSLFLAPRITIEQGGDSRSGLLDLVLLALHQVFFQLYDEPTSNLSSDLSSYIDLCPVLRA